MNKKLSFIKSKKIFSVFLLSILFLFAMLILSASSKSTILTHTLKAKIADDGIIVQNADIVKKIDMFNSVDPNLISSADKVAPHITVEYGDSISYISVDVPPAELTKVSDKVTPRIIIENADSNFNMNLTPAFPDFKMSVTPESQSVDSGSSAMFTVNLTAIAGFNSSVSLSAPGLPPDATYSFSPAFVTPPGSSTLTVNIPSDTSAGTYTITVTATGGGITHTKKINLIVENRTTVITLQPNNPYMTVNGVKKEIDPGRGTKPVIIPKWGRTVVPIRAIVEALGGTIEWEGKERKVTILFNDTTIELWIGRPKARVNGQIKWIDEKNHDVRPVIINSRTMLPLRFVAENLGCEVKWDPNTKTITITYKS